jgi:hypothetical protein
MVRIASLLALSLLLLPAARAQDTYDLRELIDRDEEVGQRVRHVKSEEGSTEQVVTNNGKVMQQRKEEKRPSQTYVDLVEELGEDGEPVRTVRTYEAFADDQGQAHDVAGLVVTLTRTTGPDGKHDWAYATADGKALPEALRAELEGSVENKRERQSKGVTDAMFNEALLPAEPQAPGATWSLDMTRLATVFGMDEGDLDLAQCKGAGAFEGVEERDGQPYVNVKFDLTFVLVNMRGQKMPPTPMNFVLTFSVSPTGHDGVLTMGQKFDVSLTPDGAPPGMSVNVKVQNDRHETRTTVD